MLRLDEDGAVDGPVLRGEQRVVRIGREVVCHEAAPCHIGAEGHKQLAVRVEEGCADGEPVGQLELVRGAGLDVVDDRTHR